MAKKKRRNKIAASLALTPVGRRNAPPGAINPAEQQFDLASPPTGPPGSTPRTAQVSKLRRECSGVGTKAAPNFWTSAL